MTVAERITSKAKDNPRRAGRIVAGVAFLVVYAVLLDGVIVGRYYAFGDLPPNAKEIALRKFFDTWHETMLGFEHQYPIHKFYFGVLTTLFGAAGQNALFLSLPALAFVSFLFLGRRFVDEGPALYVAAGLYALNPLTVGEMVNGGSGELLAYVGGPIVVEYLYRIPERESWSPVLKAGAAFGFFGVIPWTLFWIIVPFVTRVLIAARTAPRKAGRLFVSGGLGVLLSLPGVFYIVMRGGSIANANGFFAQLEWNYADATLLSVLRLAGNHGSFGLKYYGYNTEPWAFVGFVIPFVALFGWKNERLRFLYPTVGGIVIFSLLTKRGITYPMFDMFPPLWTLRSMTKLMFALSLATSLLFASGLRTILRGATRARAADDGPRNPLAGTDAASLSRIVVTGVVVISLLAYVYPAAGAMGIEGVYDDGYAIPEEYREATESLEGTVLWEPYSYTTQLRLREAYPNHVGVKSGGLATGKANARYVKRLFGSIGKGQRVYPQLRALGVDYVVVDSISQRRYASSTGEIRMETRHGAPWLFGNPAKFKERLAESPNYERVRSTENLTVFEVKDTPPTPKVAQRTGVHRVYAPTESTVRAEATGPNKVRNPGFANGTAGWWVNSRSTGTQVSETTTNGSSSLTLKTKSGGSVPVAQRFSVRETGAYRIDVDAVGDASATLYWYDGKKSSDNLTKRSAYSVSELPTVVKSKGTTLALRISAKEETVHLKHVTVTPTTYPAAKGFAANTAGIPGVTVDGYDSNADAGKKVAVNLPKSARKKVDPDVVVTDAESAIDGKVVLNDTYRQGAGVRLSEAEREAKIPDSANVVAHDTGNGTVVDYWVVGEWDRTPVTVRYSSYHPGWEGSAEATHFRAYGWANGFTETAPEEVEWTGGGVRVPIIAVWLTSWCVTLIAIGLAAASNRSG